MWEMKFSHTKWWAWVWLRMSVSCLPYDSVFLFLPESTTISPPSYPLVSYCLKIIEACHHLCNFPVVGFGSNSVIAVLLHHMTVVAPHDTTRHSTAWHCKALHCYVLNLTDLKWTVLYCIVRIALYIVLQCTALFCYVWRFNLQTVLNIFHVTVSEYGDMPESSGKR